MLEMEGLNANQRNAVAWNDGPMLVLAGPGSGKTRVLTIRVARLIQDFPESRFKVLALTFTTKAADEMRSRASQLLGPEAHRARLTTFHSFAAEVLWQHGSHFGLRPDFKILTQDADRHSLLDEAIEGADFADLPEILTGKGIVQMVDRLLRDGHFGDDEPLPFHSDWDWIRPVYNTYMRLLIRKNYLDFGTLLLCCLRLFRERPRIAHHYRTVYPFVCVDEYQDTNKAQDCLLHLLCPDRKSNLFVVADDDQIIYQWNGASPERLRKLREDYDMEVVQLPESYRCPPQVIELANNLIRHNLDRAADKKGLVSTVVSSDSEVVRFREFPEADQEMAWIARDIVARSLNPGDCTILARNTKLLASAEKALNSAGLSPYLVRQKKEFESPLLRFIHSGLRLANSPNDGGQLAVLYKAFGDLTGVNVDPEDADMESGQSGDSLLRGFVEAATPPSGPTGHPLLCTLRDHLLERLEYRDFVNNVFRWDSESSDTSYEQDSGFDEKIAEKQVWRELESKIRQQHGGKPTLNQFLQELDLRQKTSPPGRNDIQCLTVHLAKGKEFQHVYLVGLAEDQLPSYYAIQSGDRAIEEERRNCFVAITRAQESLTMTFAAVYSGWEKQPSRFLREMGLSL